MVDNKDNVPLMEYELENSVQFSPPVFRQRYGEVFQTLLDERWRTKILKLCDFGCADYGLFVFIKRLNRLTNILFVDIDEYLLNENLWKLDPLTIDFIKRREDPLTVNVLSGSVGDPDISLLNTDVVTAIEIIEHLYPDVLEAFSYNIFNYIEPKLVIVTTPNADFNIVFSKRRRFRHIDHKFEWTREQFEDWANNIVTRFPDYKVSFKGIGEGPEGTANLGCCSQMALFIRKDLLVENYTLKKYLVECKCFNELDCVQMNLLEGTCMCTCPSCSPKFAFGVCTYYSYSNNSSAINKEKVHCNNFYKSVKVIEYPFERDNKSEEEKILEEFKYRITSFAYPYSRFFVEERDRVEIPLNSLLYGFEDRPILEQELHKLLIKAGYQLEKCILQETKELEICVIIPLLMDDNYTSSSEHSDFNPNSGYYECAKEPLSDWDDNPENQNEEKAENSNKESKSRDLIEEKDSLTSEQRIEFRRERVSYRLERKGHIQSENEDQPVAIEQPKPLGEQQVEQSNKILEHLLGEAHEYLENIKRAVILRLKERKSLDAQTNERVKSEFEIESTTAQEKFEEIIDKWAELQVLNDPLHIHEAILQQKEECQKLINKKNQFIANLRKEVNKFDGGFTRDLEKQSDDIEILVQRIQQQIKYLTAVFQNQFSNIEKVILQEKQNFIDLQNQTWDDLFKKYQYESQRNCDLKIEATDLKREKLNQLSTNLAEKFRQTVFQLDRNVREARYELESIKILIFGNLSKFDYNMIVLESRADENLVIKAQQKRTFIQLRSEELALKRLIESYRNEALAKIDKFTKEIAELKRWLVQIDKKAEHFTTSNEHIFNQVWDLHKKEAFNTLKKIFTTDKIIHQQILGLHWKCPKYKDIDKHVMPSYQQALKTLNFQMKGGRITNADSLELKPKKSGERIYENENYRKLIRHLMYVLSNKSGFLTESRIKILINKFEDKERNLVKLGNVFESLGIYKPEDIDALVNEFLPYCYCMVCSESYFAPKITQTQTKASAMERDSDIGSEASLREHDIVKDVQPSRTDIEDVVMELVQTNVSITLDPLDQDEDEVFADLIKNIEENPQNKTMKKKLKKKKSTGSDDKYVCKYSHPLVISTIYIMTAIKQFVNRYMVQSTEFKTNAQRIHNRRLTISRLIEDKDIAMVWSQIKNVFSENHHRVWDSLSAGLYSYLDILKRRKSISQEVLRLREENKKLKELLDIYKSHHVLMPLPCTNLT